MAPVTTSSGSGALLPAAFYVILRRRLGEALGLAVLAAAAAFLAALVSYTPTDPSLNSAAGGAAANLMGAPGAYAADLGLQFLGAAAALPALVAAAWGWRILRRRALSLPWLRFALLAAAMVLFAPVFDALPAPDGWPLRSGLGGVAGVFLAERLVSFLTNINAAAPASTVSAAAAMAGAAALVGALGLSWSDWQNGGRRLTAGGLAFGRGLMRSRAAAAQGVAILRQRIEPTIGRAPAAADDDPGPFEPIGAPPAAEAPRRPSGLVAPRARAPKTGKRALAARQGNLDLAPSGEYRLPSVELLDAPPAAAPDAPVGRDALEQNARMLETVLEDFGVNGRIVKVRPGPVVTLYELEPAPGTKTSRVIGLADDIARSMSAVSVRVAVIPGRNVIGLELPNARRDTVGLREILAAEGFERHAGKLTLALGKDIAGAPVYVDLARMPHMLIAGTTGSGKSVALNTMILALLYQLPPTRCRFIMIDPKMLELSIYEDIPHLLCPVVTEPGKAVVALKWAVREMEERYRAMSQLGVRNIAGYNARLSEAMRKGETLTRRVQTGFDAETGEPLFEDQPLSMEPLPFLVVVVDEMADLMLVAGKDIEAAVQRLSQMARAAGIHLIMATQRPSVDVITGTIKANFPIRVSFQVTSKVDSRTIIGEQGAEQLLGQGDMIYMAGGGRIIRVHGPLVTDAEVERVVRFVQSQGTPEYLDSVTEALDDERPPGAGAGGETGDVLYDEAVALVAREGKASTSFIQRHLQIGYNRAARIVERMERDGLIGKTNRVGRREVFVGGGGDYGA